MKRERTRWFRVGAENPTRPGVYEVSMLLRGKVVTKGCEWDGKRWWPDCIYTPSGLYGDTWRGLTGPA